MPQLLVIIYGAPLSGKTTLAWTLARSLDRKSVVVSTDQLIRGAIAVPGSDEKAELDMAHTQLRLLVANYLKNGYDVVVEGVYMFERSGVLRSYEADIDQMMALMRQMAPRPVVVRLYADPAVLRRRAAEAGRDSEIETALKVNAAYKDRFGLNAVSLDTGAHDVGEEVAAVRQALGLES